MNDERSSEPDIDEPIANLRAAVADILRADPQILDSRVRELLQQHVAANADMVGDGPEIVFLKISALILACRDALREQGVDAENIGRALDKTFIEGRRHLVKEWLTFRFNVRRDRPNEAFQQIAMNFKPRGEQLYGRTFVYEHPIDTPARSEIHVKKCFFNDFFRRNGAPELTWLMCALDVVWGDELNGGPYNARFDRPTILSRGDDACRFNFVRREEQDPRGTENAPTDARLQRSGCGDKP